MAFDRELSDELFNQTLDELNDINQNGGKFDYSDYVRLHNNITRLYDSFSEVDELFETGGGGERINKYIEAIEYLKPISEHPTMTGNFCKHLKSAILSMEEMTKREKGCEYCIDISKYCGFGYAEWFEHKAADDVYEISIDVKFCPNCGRKLKGD